jgi:hypothetical protein
MGFNEIKPSGRDLQRNHIFIRFYINCEIKTIIYFVKSCGINAFNQVVNQSFERPFAGIHRQWLLLGNTTIGNRPIFHLLPSIKNCFGVQKLRKI